MKIKIRKYRSEVDTDILISRLSFLSSCVAKGPPYVASNFYMSIPAQPERDADIVLADAAEVIDQLSQENENLKKLVMEKDHA